MNEELLKYKLDQVESRLSVISGAIEKIAEAMQTLTLIEAHQKVQYKSIESLQLKVSELEDEINNLKLTQEGSKWLASLGSKLVFLVVTAVVSSLLTLITLK
jgi:prefoldin subunit 5